MPSQSEIQAEITTRILDALKQGVVPWRKPWRNDPNSGSPANVISKRLYSGINPILLDLMAMSRGYTSKLVGHLSGSGNLWVPRSGSDPMM